MVNTRGTNAMIPDDQQVDGKTALSDAVTNGDAEKVRTLLRSRRVRADISMANGRTALHVAASLGNLDTCRALIEYDAEVNENDLDGISPLHLAAQNGHVEVAELLLKHGAMVDAYDERGATALHLAAMHSHEEMCKLLLETGATLAESDFGTPFDCAVGAACKEILSEKKIEDF